MKRGQAHIEVIISFVLFITVITFLLVYIQPQKSSVLENSLVENVYESFVNAGQTRVDIALINRTGIPCKPSIFVGNATKVDLKTGYYYVYVSKYVNNTLQDCSSDDFVIGNIQKNNILSEVLLNQLKEKYYNNYVALKTELNIPDSIDFAIVSSNYELNRTIPDGLSVSAKIYRLKKLYFNGTIKNEDFIVKIW